MVAPPLSHAAGPSARESGPPWVRECSPTVLSTRSTLQRRTHHGEWAEWDILNFGSSVTCSPSSPHSFLRTIPLPFSPSICSAPSYLSPCSASYYELTVDLNKKEKQKSSGLAIFTGSGSTAWAYNINRVTPFQVGKILQLGEEAIKCVVLHVFSMGELSPAPSAQTMEKGSADVHANVVDKGALCVVQLRAVLPHTA